MSLLATKEDFNSVTARMRSHDDQLAELNAAMSKIAADQKKESSRLENKLERMIDAKIGSARGNIASGSTYAGGASVVASDGKDRSFWRARHSIRVWPVEGMTEPDMREAFVMFVRLALRISENEIADLKIEAVRRTRSSPKSRIHLEVCVTFSDMIIRDEIASKGRMLADYVDEDGRPSAGIRMDIPPFLTSTF